MSADDADKSKELTRSQLETRVIFKPEYNAARTTAYVQSEAREKGLELFDMTMHLADESKKVHRGDLSSMEAMLTAQAHTLDALFNSMVQRAAQNMGSGYLRATDAFMRMALKAQSQCRCTVEALSELKNPRTPMFVKQQNIANQQQVNNGAPAAVGEVSPRVQENDIPEANKLLEHQHGERLDFGAQGAAGGINSNVAAMAEFNRTKDRGG